jgi:hypothetical protein
MKIIINSLLIAFAFSFSSSVYGQFTLYTAVAQSMDGLASRWKISTTNSRIARADILNVTVVDLASGDQVKYSDLIAYDHGAQDTSTVATSPQMTGFYLTDLAMEKSGKYLLIMTVKVKDKDGNVTGFSTTHEVKLDEASIRSADSEPPKSPPNSVLKVVKSGPKDKSDFYFAGEIVRTSGTKATYSADIKIEPKFGRGKWTYSPFFNLLANTDAEADPDSMNLGFKATRSFPFHGRAISATGFRSIYLSLGGKIEAERDFDNANAIFDPRVTFRATPIAFHDKAILYLKPFIGTELGKNLKSPLAEAEHKPIARGLAGLDLIFDFPIEKPIDDIVISGSWTRRWLMKRELGFEVNDDKTLSLTQFGRTPRDWIEAKIDFGINKFFAPYIGYEWGQVPPSYKLIDHRVKIGLSYKFSLSKNL